MGVIIIHVPSLNDRREDIPLLIDHFLHIVATEYGQPKKEIEKKAIEYLKNYNWTGNIRELRNVLATKISNPVTFGWGPRFLHSTGQFHKGGQSNGSFLQITAGFEKDYEIPGKKFSFGTLIMAQSIGDQNALEKRGLKTMRLHLLNRPEGIKQLLEIAKKL